MRLFLRMLGSDIRYGMRGVVGRLALVALIALFAAFMAYTSVFWYWNRIGIDTGISVSEALIGLVGGMTKFVPRPGVFFKFPMTWLALLIVAAYVTLDYPVRDLSGMGTHLIVAAGSRWPWWLAKCCWVVLCTLVWTLVIALVCVLTVVLTGGSWDWAPSYEAVFACGLSGEGTRAQAFSIADFALAAPLALMALLLVQLVLTVFVGPYLGLAVTVAVLFFSAFYLHPALLGNYLMAARSNAMLDGGVDPAVGAALSAALIVVSVVLGGVAFNRKDIMGRKDGAS